MNEPVITVIGNLVADPELRMSQAGKPWVTFRIASTPRVRDRQTEQWTDGETLWLGCRAFGEQAENIANSLTKGTRVIVQGRLSSRSYTDNQGQQRTSLDLDVDEIGPGLRFATAQVTRAASRGQMGGFGGGNQQGQPGWGQSASEQPSSPWADSSPSNDSPWGASSGGDENSFGDQRPF
jgi:single-strand DNA-binding protein